MGQIQLNIIKCIENLPLFCVGFAGPLDNKDHNERKIDNIHTQGGATLQLGWTSKTNPCALTLFFW